MIVIYYSTTMHIFRAEKTWARTSEIAATKYDNNAALPFQIYLQSKLCRQQSRYMPEAYNEHLFEIAW